DAAGGAGAAGERDGHAEGDRRVRRRRVGVAGGLAHTIGGRAGRVDGEAACVGARRVVGIAGEAGGYTSGIATGADPGQADVTERGHAAAVRGGGVVGETVPIELEG